MTNQEVIKQQNDYCNVTGWNTSKFTGKGVVIMNCEGNSTHGQQTKQRILDAAPDATVINASIGTLTSGGDIYKYDVYYNNISYSLEDFIVKYKVKILTQSNHGGTEENTWYSQELNALKKKYNLIFLNLSGNVGETCNGAFPSDVAIWIGACSLIKGSPQYVKQFCNGTAKEFTDFMGWNWGTSFSTPYFAGKCALLIQRYGDLTQDEVFEYLKMICMDLETVGMDIYTGYGLPILPSTDKKYTTMQIGNNNYFVDGAKFTMDTTPVNLNGNTLVPLRTLCDILGATIKTPAYNADKSMHIEITKGNIVIVLNTGSKLAKVNGQDYTLNEAPLIDKNNRTLIPLKFVSEVLNCKVGWVQSLQKVLILEK